MRYEPYQIMVIIILPLVSTIVLLASWSCVSIALKNFPNVLLTHPVQILSIECTSRRKCNLSRYPHSRALCDTRCSSTPDIAAKRFQGDEDIYGLTDPMKVNAFAAKDISKSTPVVHQQVIDIASQRRRLQLFWAIQFATMYQYSKPCFGDGSAISTGSSAG